MAAAMRFSTTRDCTYLAKGFGTADLALWTTPSRETLTPSTALACALIGFGRQTRAV